MNGDLEQVDGRWQLRFVRRLRHSPDIVWRALTEPEQLMAWFPQRVVGEWKVGSPLRFEFAHGEFAAFDGEVTACQHGSLLEFRWGTDIIRFEVAASADGCTLTLIDTIDELGKAARDGAGWHACLDVLELELDGTAPPWTPSAHWADVHAGYVDKFGPAAAVMGPPQPPTGADTATP